MAVRKKEEVSDEQPLRSESQKTKQEWIESAAYLGAERFEIAGALFHLRDTDLIRESEVRSKIKAYRGERL
ncbi:hypothetical protein EDM54_01650 [Brevibacillus borstelensis]|uniref:hypothetical protein n=1 Tax=Brevibacillus borstelensis TaxID=45462 RepID=UPI000F078CD7|nr:hypothetical protein [Brevibacillus borstelensis]MED2006700.1 hypothetical protein [Brevibacillus borstelensis]RNB66402.1 hypothetical protein EDM54_01650 [Brevibacillus borstelensis]GED53538.1 hypothetical protein BBO01nite_27790 [Brevibacillus borstelensis]